MTDERNLFDQPVKEMMTDQTITFERLQMVMKVFIQVVFYLIILISINITR